jgi:FtsP/CotA-like multicopper oxidase with cupredoxin domain
MRRRRFLQLGGTAAVAAVLKQTSAWSAQSPAGAFDQEVFLAARHWEPLVSSLDDDAGRRKVAYRYAGFHDKLLRGSEAIRVHAGERVLFHFLNASATEDVLLHLPGHHFTVVGLDGNPVPQRAAVDVVSLTVGERVDAVVEMRAPGNWLLGSVDDDERARGLGVVVRYSNGSGATQWRPPAALDWSYARFSASRYPAQPDQVIEMLLEKRADGARHWEIDGRSCPEIELPLLEQGRRYRLRIMNATGWSDRVHLHGHDFEVTRINQIPVAGIFKHTVRLERYNVVEVDVVVAHQQKLVMDSGYMRRGLQIARPQS